MIRLIQVEELEQLLLQVPRIVELQDHQPAAFVARAEMWMDLVEQALVSAHSYQAAKVAALRSELGFARTATPPKDAEHHQPTRKTQLVHEAAHAMTEAAAIAAVVLDEHRPRIADAERRLNRVVAKARSQGLVAPSTVPAEARRAIARQRDLERQFVEVEGIVGADDALVLLGRALSPTQASARIADRGQQGSDSAGHGR